MKIVMDNELKLAQVWCSHADQRDEAKQKKLKEFIADCRKEKFFVCVYESGDGSLLENTKELLTHKPKEDWLKKHGHWDEILDRYLYKKNTNDGLVKKSRALYAETINEIYTKYSTIKL